MKYFGFLCGLWLLLSSSWAYGCQLNMRVWAFAPQAMQNEQRQWIGADLDYGHLLAQKLDCRLNLIEAPWAKGIEMLKSGQVDFMVNVTKTTEREKYFYFVGPQRDEVIRLASIKGALPLISTWQQMTELDAVLMRQRGSVFGPRFQQLLKENQKLNAKLLNLIDNKTRVDLLTRQRASGILVDEVYIDYYNQQNNAVKLEKHPLIIKQQPVYYAFSKVSITPEQLDKIQKVFVQLAKSKSYQHIYKQYQ